MKYGMRPPGPRRSFKARTTAKWKRQAKKALIPGYGKKGMGWVRNPRKAAYNNRQRRMAWLENVDKSAYIASEAIEGIGGNFVIVG